MPANSNNSTSLYSFTPSTTVSTNNFTTLYNATPGNVTTANVPDRNFTTLYTKQSDISPTYPYGNSNVEAFLNVGSDPGGNIVQNIVMSGNLNVGSQSNLGDVGNVHITGGNLNYVLQTDGNGGLNWAALPGSQGNITTYTHFDVVSTGNNQTFTNANLIVFANSNSMAVFKNGINIEPSQYNISGNILTINIPLITGDTIDVLPSSAGGGGGSPAGGNITEVQYNGGSGLFSGNSLFTFDQANSRLNITNITAGLINASANLNSLVVTGNSYLGGNSNVFIYGGSNGQVLSTDGAGNLSWANSSAGGGTPAGSNNYVQYNNNGNFGGSGNFTFDSATNTLTVPNIVGTVANANYASFAGAATTAGSATTAGAATNANYALYAGNVTANNQPNITSVGQLYNLSVGYSGIVDFTNTSNVSLGSVGNVKITGGSGGQFLSTNGSGDLSWQTATVANANYASYAGTVFYTNASIGSTSLAGFSPGYQGAFYLVGDNGNRAELVSASNDGNLTLGANLQFSTGPTRRWVFTSSGNLVLPGNTFAVNYANGTQVPINNVANANYANFAGNVVNGVQSNIYSLGTLTSLDVNGLVNIAGNVIITGGGNGNLRVDGDLDSRSFTSVKTAFEKFNKISGSAGGVTSLYIDIAAIYYYDTAATSNITLDITSFTSTVNSTLANSQSSTVAFLNTVGATPYVVTSVRIDGATQTVKYVNGYSPTVGTRLSNCVQSYTYTMLKTGVATYTVLGQLTEYQ
jgi:hypothetical protein